MNIEDPNLFKIIMKQLPVAIAIFDKDLNYMFVNDLWEQETNLDLNEIIGKNIYEVVQDLPLKWKKIHQRALNGEHLMAVEDAFNREDGSKEWWRCRVLPWYNTQKEISGITLFVEKITERKLLEIKMKGMIGALNRSNADLERFAHICAHDLNEPLRTIANYGQLLETEFRSTLKSTGRIYLDHIMKSIKHLGLLIDGILDYSQLNTPSLKKSTFHLDPVIEALHVALEKQIKEKNAFIFYEKLPKFYGDRALISCVFQNIINNALKFNKSDMPIVRISCKEKKSSFLFCIEDNGIGIEAAYLKQIFALFKRLHRSSEYEGTGLGLSIARRIIETHGGRMWAQSVLNEGSQFFFTLPKS